MKKVVSFKEILLGFLMLGFIGYFIKLCISSIMTNGFLSDSGILATLVLSAFIVSVVNAIKLANKEINLLSGQDVDVSKNLTDEDDVIIRRNRIPLFDNKDFIFAIVMKKPEVDELVEKENRELE